MSQNAGKYSFAWARRLFFASVSIKSGHAYAISRNPTAREIIKIIMKICVYAIAKNEEKFAERWYSSVSEADGVFVLDTGSTDRTAEILSGLGAAVKVKKIEPWRFDDARNESLAMVPSDADLCVCTDIDEVFLPGWREKLERAAKLNPNANLFAVRYVWSQTEDGGDGITFNIKKIHRRDGFVWKGAVHEVVQPMPGVPLVEAVVEGAKIVHMPDPEKSRAQYLPLLIQAVKEDPLNDRNSFYLGREYFFRGMNAECVKELTRHLSLPTARWDEERSASRRYMANAYVRLGDDKNAMKNYILAVGEYPYSREPWIALASFSYAREQWDGVIWAAENALKIQAPSSSYLNLPESFSAYPHDVLSIAYFKTGRPRDALKAARNALALDPDNSRIKANIELMEKSQ